MTRCRVYFRSKLSKFLPDVLAEPARFYFWRFLRRLELPGVTPTLPAKKAEGREFQDCYCVEIGLCWAPSAPSLRLGVQPCSEFWLRARPWGREYPLWALPRRHQKSRPQS